MLPGVGIFGSDPISKVLIQILKHFDFEVHAVWTNNLIEVVPNNSLNKLNNKSLTNLEPDLHKLAHNSSQSSAKLITTSIDNVLLNKNVNLVFVCCQPNLHSQIATKALGIGKNVICLFPTCKDLEEIQHMINSARYYPSLMSSISYGGLKYLNEFKLLKQSLQLVGQIKSCNIVVNCQNLALTRNNLLTKSKTDNASVTDFKKEHQRSGSISSLIDNINLAASQSQSSESINWLSDRDLGAGVLNRFGASIISMILNLFDNRRITKVYGCLKTFIDELDSDTKTKGNNYRKITADDYCTFQLNLEPESILVSVCINSIAQSKYSQEVSLCGTKGVLQWTSSNSKIQFRSTNKSVVTKVIEQQKLKSNNSTIDSLLSNSSIYFETEIVCDTQPLNLDSNNNNLLLSNNLSKASEIFLNSYKNMEEKYPELPLLYIKGLFYYLENVKKKFLERNINNNSNSNSDKQQKNCSLDNFEHTKIVQSIVKHITISSLENRWITVNY
jgi:predicted dehydrogenase